MNCYAEATLKRRVEPPNACQEGALPNCMFADVQGRWPSRGCELKGIVDALGLTGQCETVTLVTIRDQKRGKWRMRRVGFLLGIDNDSTLRRLHVLATPKICLRVQQTAADPEGWQHLTALKLADQLQKHPVIIDVLIGLCAVIEEFAIFLAVEDVHNHNRLFENHLMGNFEVECSSALQIHLKTENIKYCE
ncbi:putative hydrogenase expression/formation protein HypC [Trichinella spiralis]|uniref:putative hydrogenase expression/formation protein HypC n=1 Tax=Trichinella spiralis TaxID=6334 RepID=UPI0001EFDD56|nr:putative hydrogenase expression/formation protein HypC [Trichinella spiralis]